MITLEAEVDDKFMASDNRHRFLVGGDPLAMAALCVRDLVSRAQRQAPSADGVRRTRWIFIYQHNGYDSGRLLAELFRPLPGRLDIVKRSYRICHDDFEAEVRFRSWNDVRDVIDISSCECTGVVITDAELAPPDLVFSSSARAGRYPPSYAGRCSWGGVIGPMNSPAEGSWARAMYDCSIENDWEFFTY